MADDRHDDSSKPAPRRQLELPIAPSAPREPAIPPVTAPAQRAFRIIKGEGKKRDETLRTRNDVARLLVASAADVMLRRISVDRAHEIETKVERVMKLFDRADDPLVQLLLRRELDQLEALWREGQEKRNPR